MTTFSRLCLGIAMSGMLLLGERLNAQTVINTVTDLQAMQNDVTASYVLGGNIDASSTSTANGGVGFTPIGTASKPFTGTFDGKGYTITGLSINSSLPYVGLFGYIASPAVIQNVSLSGVSVTGIGTAGNVGTLVGYMGYQTTVTQCSAQGTLQATNATNVGGLVAYSYGGSVTYSQAAVNVTQTTAGGSIGGLVGYSASAGYFQTIYTPYANIQYSQASGNVSGITSGTSSSTQAYVGGLVGRTSISQITHSRATGNVTATGASLVGGLLGQNGGWLIDCIENYCNNGNVLQAVGITYSFATGSVSTGAGGDAGGLIGDTQDGYIYQDFATGSVTNTDGGGREGGLLGVSEGSAVEDSYVTGSVTDNTALAMGGLIGLEEYFYYASKWQITPILSELYSIGAVQGQYPKYAGGLVGEDTSGRGATCAYWATDSSFQSNSADGTGILLAQLENGTLPGCFDPAVWTPSSGPIPTLTSNPSPVYGYINPKYQVIGVTYAPPGASSGTYVQYTSGSTVGTSQTLSQSFQQSSSTTVTYGIGQEESGTIPYLNVTAGSSSSVSLANSQMASETIKQSTTYQTSFQVQEGEKTYGTGNYFYPVDHDYDVLWIWLNPTLAFTVYPPGSAGSSTISSVEWNGYGFDTHDQSDVHVVGIALGYLNGDFGSIPPEYKAAFARSWAAGQTYGAGDGSALTSTDLAQIIAFDPFAVSTYGQNYITPNPPSPSTRDSRFTISDCSGESGVPYLQANPNATSQVYTCSLTNQNTQIRMQDITMTYQQTYSIDKTSKDNFAGFDFSKETKDQYQLTWTTEDQTSTSSSSTTSAQLSVQGPPCNNTVQGIGPCSPVYDSNGDQPIQFDVYQDNLYGTFMFAPVNYYTSTLNTTVSVPVFSPAGGSYATKQTVTISDATPTASIFYTMNGTMPTTSSELYSGPIAVGTSETIQAIAVAADLSNSGVADASYTITNPQAATSPTFSLASGSYSSPQTVTIVDATAGSSIYYTVNGSVPTANSTPYAGPIVVNSTETIEAIAVANGYANSPASSATYTISGPAVAAAPTFSLPSGTYSSSQTVAIFDTAPNATIYYTTNGSTPTASSAFYSAPITVGATETLEAIAVATGYTTSPAASATYTITPPTATPTFSTNGGTYSSAQIVTISDSTPGAAIYYTTNGSQPTTASAPYTTAITVSTTETIEAIAIAPGYSPSTTASAAYSINEPGADFQIASSASTLNIVQGKSSTATITITPQYGFGAQVSFGCGGLPSEATCNFSPVSVTPSGGPQSSTLTISTTASSAMLHDTNRGVRQIAFALLLPGLVMMWGIAPRSRNLYKALRPLALLLLLMASLGIAACGSGTSGSALFGNPGTPTGSAVVTVYGVSNGATATTHEALISVTVTQ